MITSLGGAQSSIDPCGVFLFFDRYHCPIYVLVFLSQVAPLDMFKEANTGTNLPAQIEIYSVPGNEYKFMFIAKGGGSANKTFLYQQVRFH